MSDHVSPIHHKRPHGDRSGTITALIPAHNEEHRLAACVDSLANQTVQPTRIVVIADNCTDRTALLAEGYGCEVFKTANNTQAKAGGLNQWLSANLESLKDNELLLVMDADGWLDPECLENAIGYLDLGYAACGGVFRAENNGTFVGFFQANEYERYRYLLRRSKGRTLVLTGTATLFKAHLLKEVLIGRECGIIPSSGDSPESVYSVKTLVEDLELTLAIKHLGHSIIAPIDCSLETETMDTWRGLAKQRYRWKLGALQAAWQHGFTQHTSVFHRLQALNLLGIAATLIYLSTLAAALLAGPGLHVKEIWLWVTLVYMIERTITVWRRGWEARVMAFLLLPEMIFDITLQLVQLRAITSWVMRRKQKDWYGGTH